MPKKILIIDDEEDFITLLKINIEKTTAYEVLVARSGEAGLELMTMHTPEIKAVQRELEGKRGLPKAKNNGLHGPGPAARSWEQKDN